MFAWAGGLPIRWQGRLASSNAEQVRLLRGILEALSLEIASPAEARAMLDLKGGANVGSSEHRLKGRSSRAEMRLHRIPDLRLAILRAGS